MILGTPSDAAVLLRGTQGFNHVQESPHEIDGNTVTWGKAPFVPLQVSASPTSAALRH